MYIKVHRYLPPDEIEYWHDITRITPGYGDSYLIEFEAYNSTRGHTGIRKTLSVTNTTDFVEYTFDGGTRLSLEKVIERYRENPPQSRAIKSKELPLDITLPIKKKVSFVLEELLEVLDQDKPVEQILDDVRDFVTN